ncbi:MAG: outer membrane protein assembly factor BamD [Proteobacteria bacterium]|nr:outer membrane protein assembly factor BamD [Pseudomonadota bacterium]MBU1709371.1 outer membrane protein assembly factor BamD [Pseudomonadota bacterium]
MLPIKLHISKTISFIFILLAIAVATGISGCASQEIERENEAGLLAQEGLDDFNRGKYNAALEIFEKLKNRYPFSPQSLLAELKAADCNFYLDNFEESRVLYEEFERNHPTNEAIPYVYFQVGMSFFKQIDTTDRDPAGALDSIQAFLKLIKTYPESPYTVEARARISEARDFLATHEYRVAVYYTRKGSLEEAASRLDYLLLNYPDSKIAPEAKVLKEQIEQGTQPGRPWYLWIPGVSMFLN